MADTVLRIFSYLPNPRVFKASIVARMLGVELDIRGTEPKGLSKWLWDFDARPMKEGDSESLAHCARPSKTGFNAVLFKTDAFLEANPWGTVPAAFSPDGRVGLFESNSIMRAVARAGTGHSLYGLDGYTASRIDGFLDVSLLFARDVQAYVLELYYAEVSAAVYSNVVRALDDYLSGVERALSGGKGFLVGDSITLADVCFVAEMALLKNEGRNDSSLKAKNLSRVASGEVETKYPKSFEHFRKLVEHPAFSPDLKPYLEGIPPE